MMKKVLTMTLALSMILVLFMGCQSANTSSNASSGASSSAQNTVNAATATPTTTKEPDKLAYLNMDGYTPIVKEGTDITLTVMSQVDDTLNGDPKNAWLTTYIKKVLNVNLDIQGAMSSTISEKSNLMFASQNLPDLLIWMEQTVFDLTNGDQQYRATLATAVLPYVVESYPDNVYFLEKDATRLNELSTVINDYVKNEAAKFITGSKSIDTEMDAYYTNLDKLGFKEYLQFYTDAYAKYLAVINK
jgi:ABC-type Fe3+-hydroxamate transport system substrate-binding protein